MNICFITPTYFPIVGGTEIAISEISKRLVEQKHQVTIIAPIYPDVPVRESIMGVEIHRIPMFDDRAFYRVPLRQYVLFKKILELNKVNGFNLLHQFHLFKMGGACVLAKKILKIPLITSLMGYDTYNPKGFSPRYLDPYIGWIMNNSEVVISPSRELANHAKNQNLKKNAIIIPHGIYVDKFIRTESLINIREVLRIGASEIIVLSVQRLHEVKKVECLIKSIPGVVEKNASIKFVICGEGPERNKLEDLCKILNIQKHVFFTGFVPHNELPSYYTSCDIFALHSTYEAFGIVLTEAMAAGKPVVATDVGAIPEVVDHGRTGLLVPPKDPDALAEAILTLANDRELRERIGYEGRRKAEQEYDWDKIVDKYVELYQEYR